MAKIISKMNVKDEITLVKSKVFYSPINGVLTFKLDGKEISLQIDPLQMKSLLKGGDVKITVSVE